MAKITNTGGGFSPSSDTTQQPNTPPSGGLTPELQAALAASGMSQEQLMAMIQANQATPVGGAPLEGASSNPLAGASALPEDNTISNDFLGGANPFDTEEGLNTIGQEPDGIAAPSNVVRPEERNFNPQTGELLTPDALRAQKIEQARIEEEERVAGAVGFKQRTREEFAQAYSPYGTAGEVNALSRAAYKIGTGGMKGKYQVKDSETGNVNGEVPVQFAARNFQSSPVETVNATLFTHANLAGAVSGRRNHLRNNPGEDAAEDDLLASVAGLAEVSAKGAVRIDTEGRTVINAEIYDQLMAGTTRAAFNRVRNSELGPMENQGSTGNSQNRMLINAGYLEESFEVPVDPAGNPIENAVPERMYRMTEMGDVLSNEVKGFTKKQKGANSAINQPLGRSGARKAHGAKPGSPVYSGNLKGKKSDKAAGKRSEEKTPSYQYAEDYVETPVKYNQAVLQHNDQALKTWLQLFNIERDGGQLTPDQKKTRQLIQHMYQLEPHRDETGGFAVDEFSGDPIVTNLRSTESQIKRAMSLGPDFYKREADSHGASNRITNTTSDMNEQESPRVMKGAMEGAPRTYSLGTIAKLVRNNDMNARVISEGDWTAYRKYIREGKGKPSMQMQQIAMLESLGSWIVPETRSNTVDYLAENFTVGDLKAFAEMGAVVAEFNQAPDAVLQDEAKLKLYNQFLEQNAAQDKGKENGFYTKAALQARALWDGGAAGNNSIAFSPVASSADQSSAGRTWLGFDAGDEDTIEHVGLAYNPDVSGTDLFPNGNPRMFFLKSMQARLVKSDGMKGLTVPQMVELSNAISEPPPNVDPAEYADNLGKLALMVTDYGKSRHFHEGAVKKFFKVYPEIKGALDSIAQQTTMYNSGIELGNRLLGLTLGDVSNPWHSVMLKGQAKMAALLGFNMGGKLSDGSNIRVGVTTYNILDEDAVTYTDSEGDTVYTGAKYSKAPKDSPAARAKANWDKETQKYFKRRIGSAQENAIGPLLGHLREVEVNALAHAEVKRRLGDDYYFSNVHDNVIGDPMYMAMFVEAIPAAIKQIANHDILQSVNDDFNASLKDVAVRIHGMSNDIAIGPGAKDPALQQWTEYFDELMDDYQDGLKRPDDRFEWLQNDIKKKLRFAYEKRLWAPKSTQFLDNIELTPRSPMQGTIRAIEKHNLEKYLTQFLIPGIHDQAKTWLKLKPKIKDVKERTIDSLKHGQGFMKTGRDKPAPIDLTPYELEETLPSASELGF